MQKASDNVQVVKNTATISLFNVLGLIVGLAVDVLLAARFGLGREMDALFIALTLPQLIFAVLFGAFNAVLVPSFSHARTERGNEGAWRLFSSVATTALLVVAVLALLGVLGSASIISIMAPGLDQTTKALAVRLNSIVFWMLLPAGVTQAASAVLNTYHRFAAPSALNLVQYSVVLVFALLGIPKWGITAVAAGYVVAAFAQLAVLALAIRRIGGRYRPALNWHDPEIRKVGSLLGPLLVQSGISQSSTLVERLLASFLPPGSISAVGYARRILRAVSDIFLTSASTALLPQFSALMARKDVPGLKRAVGFGVKLVSFVTLPVVALLAVLNVPIIRVAFQRGAFDASATRLTAGLMALYVLSVLPQAIFQVIVNAFFAMRDALTPIYLRLFALVINLALDVALIAVIGPYGLALSLLLARCVGLTAAFLALRWRVGALELRLKAHFLKIGLAAGLMAAVALGVRWLSERRTHLPLPQQLAVVALASLLGLMVYGVVTVAAGIEEVDEAVALIKKRLMGRSATKVGRPERAPECGHESNGGRIG